MDVTKWARKRAEKELRENNAQLKQEELDKEAAMARLMRIAEDAADEHTEAVIKEIYTKRSYANTYRNKNKERINKMRRMRDATPKGVFNKAKGRAKQSKQRWNLEFTNWWHAWNASPKVYDDSAGVYRTAWEMRNGDVQKGTQLRRIDTSKPWQVTNVHVVYRNQPIPEHGIIAPWDFKRSKPVLPKDITDAIAAEKQK